MVLGARGLPQLPVVNGTGRPQSALHKCCEGPPTPVDTPSQRSTRRQTRGEGGVVMNGARYPLTMLNGLTEWGLEWLRRDTQCNRPGSQYANVGGLIVGDSQGPITIG